MAVSSELPKSEKKSKVVFSRMGFSATGEPIRLTKVIRVGEKKPKKLQRGESTTEVAAPESLSDRLERELREREEERHQAHSP